MISRSQQLQARLIFSSMVRLLIFVLCGCNPDAMAGDPASDTLTQNDTAATGNHQPSAMIATPEVFISGQTVTLGVLNDYM